MKLKVKRAIVILALAAAACNGTVEETPLEPDVVCAFDDDGGPDGDCGEGYYCAALPSHRDNLCRPACTSDDECGPDSRCVNEIDWHEDGSPKAYACQGWRVRGYSAP